MESILYLGKIVLAKDVIQFLGCHRQDLQYGFIFHNAYTNAPNTSRIWKVNSSSFN